MMTAPLFGLRHYKAIAKVLKRLPTSLDDYREVDPRETALSDFSRLFKLDNPQFDWLWFRRITLGKAAPRPEGEKRARPPSKGTTILKFARPIKSATQLGYDCGMDEV